MDPVRSEIDRLERKRKADFPLSRLHALTAEPIPGKVHRPALVAPTLPHTPGMNRQQRRAARKKKR